LTIVLIYADIGYYRARLWGLRLRENTQNFPNAMSCLDDTEFD